MVHFSIRIEQVLPALIRSWYTPELLFAVKVMPVNTATLTHLNLGDDTAIEEV